MHEVYYLLISIIKNSGRIYRIEHDNTLELILWEVSSLSYFIFDYVTKALKNQVHINCLAKNYLK